MSRLYDLADYLEMVVPEEYFDILHLCGSAKCAFGWAITLWSKELQISSYNGMVGVCYLKKPDLYCWWHVAVEFFNVTQDEVYYMFSVNSYGWSYNPKIEEVVKRIREVAHRYEEKVDAQVRTTCGVS